MAEVSTTTNNNFVQVFINDWEIQLLVLLSFALQVFLFVSGGFRRRTSHWLLRLLIWLAYLSADYVAVYALGYLSRHVPTSTTGMDDLTLLWAPFLLIHLGGQDTVTAFSVEDNELWLRHLLNLLVQVWLVVNVLWNKSVVARNPFLVPAACLLAAAGIVKYGERIWALKLGTRRAQMELASSEVTLMEEVLPVQEVGTELTYQTMVLYALHCEGGLRHVFSGRKIDQMSTGDWVKFIYFSFPDERVEAARVAFKIVEIELSIMYDRLFTKSRVVQTTTGAILRCVSLASTVAAFLLFIVMGITSSSRRRTQGYTRADAAITYALFIGAFCLEACAVFIVAVSPRAWAIMKGRGGAASRVLARVSWSVFVRIQPETRPWWSNSMGQYNLVDYLAGSSKSRSSWVLTAVTKMMDLVGAGEDWNNMRYTKRVTVPMEIKRLINQTIDWDSLQQLQRHPAVFIYEDGHETTMSLLQGVLKRPFEDALLVLHVYTDLLLHWAGMVGNVSAEMRGLMDTCKGMSDYMFYLLLVHPAMLPVTANDVQRVLAQVQSLRESKSLEDHGYSPERLLGHLQPTFMRKYDRVNPYHRMNPYATLKVLQRVWAQLLVYAAGKSRPEEHTRLLSMGGELLTFAWLLMAHQVLGDQGKEVDISAVRWSMETVSPREAKAKRWSEHMVSLLWMKRCSACLTASICLTAGRADPAPAPAAGGGSEAVEAEPEDGAEAEAVAACHDP